MTEKQLPATKADANNLDAIARLVITGDLSKLDDKQKTEVYVKKCESAGIPWQIQPYDYIPFQGKTVLYLNTKGLAHLNKKHNASHEILEAAIVENGQAYKVTAKAFTPDGRYEVATKYLPLMYQKFSWRKNEKGNSYKELHTNPDGTPIMLPLSLEERLNVYMKCETQAKNRASKALFGESGPDEEPEPHETTISVNEAAQILLEATKEAKAEVSAQVAAGTVDLETVEITSDEFGEATVSPSQDAVNLKVAEIAKKEGNEALAKSAENAALISPEERQSMIKHVVTCGYQVTDLAAHCKTKYNKAPKDLTNTERAAIIAHFTSIKK